jgi:hypothetical protein
MSITLEFYPIVEKSSAPDNNSATALFKQFNNELNEVLESSESSQFIAFNASECMAFQIANLSFIKALTLAQFINDDVNQQINEMIKNHLQWARRRLYYGLCCYVNDAMYPTIADSPVYVRDLAACFRMAVFNKAITSDVHNVLAQFVTDQPIETVMLAVSNFEQESETLALMRSVHQLAIKTIYEDCCKWYKISVPAWNAEFVRPLEYSYQHQMWLDTYVIVHPATQNYQPAYKRVPIMCPKFMINPTMTEALARFEFLKVTIPFDEQYPTFNKIQICNIVFERNISDSATTHQTKEQTVIKSDAEMQTSPTTGILLVDQFDKLLLQIKQCQLKLQEPVKPRVPLVKSTWCKDIQLLLESMK